MGVLLACGSRGSVEPVVGFAVRLRALELVAAQVDTGVWR
jgi:hypothetical protein